MDKKIKFLRLLLLLAMVSILVGCGKAGKGAVSGEDNVTYEVVEEGADEKSVENSVNGTIDESAAKSTYSSTKETSLESALEDQDDLNNYDFTLSFVGDINFDENWATMEYYDKGASSDISNCISPTLIQIMKDADVMTINNEFTYSLAGSPLEGKMYTFRANPERVNILTELGVDVVNLANNHVYDYGEDALIDTMDTLTEADIGYFGAGENLEEAMSPVYFYIQDKKIAYVGASRAEKNQMTPQATEESPGILRCYDTELFIDTIEEARENADFVIANVHWGTEYSYELEDVQLQTSKDYIDAGADIIVGAHPHVLQGMEFYKGKPIIYSLGNFWFNEKTLDTMLLNVRFYGDDNEGFTEVEVVPAIQSDNVTSLVTQTEEKERIFSFLEDISINVDINEEGLVSESQ